MYLGCVRRKELCQEAKSEQSTEDCAAKGVHLSMYWGWCSATVPDCRNGCSWGVGMTRGETSERAVEKCVSSGRTLMRRSSGRMPAQSYVVHRCPA